MKELRIGIFAICLLGLMSCSTGEKSLYSWDKYENVYYNFVKDPSEKNKEKLIECYDKIINKQNGTRKVVPPGLYAERAYVYIQQGKKAEAIELLNKEIAVYPESKPFIDRLLNQLNK